MPERLSEVGRRRAEALATETDIGKPDEVAPLPWRVPPVPEAANGGELDQLRYELRVAEHELRHQTALLAALHHARERARDGWRATAQSVSEAETTLSEVRKRPSRRSLCQQ